MNRAHLCLAGLLIAGSCVHLSAAMGGEDLRSPETETYATKIIWANEAEEHPAFLPQGLLQGADIDQLPLNRHAKSSLRDKVERLKDFGSGYCSEPRLYPEQGQAETTFGFQEFLIEVPASFIGTIVHVESGWAVARRLVAEMVYMEVNEVLTQRRADLSPNHGDVVAVLFFGGSTVISDTVFCQKRTAGFFKPTVGDQVLVGGQLAREGSVYFYESFVFPVRDGQVVSQPIPKLAENEVGISMEQLRREISQAIPQREQQ